MLMLLPWLLLVLRRQVVHQVEELIGERELLRQANERKSGEPNYSANVGSYTENGYKTIYVIKYDESGMPIQPDPTIYEQCENDNTVAFLRRDWNVSYSDAYHRIVCI